MFWELLFPFESFIALVAREWSLHGMPLHVPLQITILSGSVIALVTFEWLLSCVHPHHVNFQLTRLNACIIAWGAPLWLFSRVCSLVGLQLAWCYCFIFALIALVLFFLGVLLDMVFECGCLVARKVALYAPVWFLPAVNEGVGLQINFLNEWLVTLWTTEPLDATMNEGVPLQITNLTKWLIALWATEPLDPTMDLIVFGKTLPTCKCLRTQVTRHFFQNLQ